MTEGKKSLNVTMCINKIALACGGGGGGELGELMWRTMCADASAAKEKILCVCKFLNYYAVTSIFLELGGVNFF